MAKPKRINLALQGGGAHGALTWGVIDTFLADERIEIAAISGTSAGAMNAVLTADGLTQGGGVSIDRLVISGSKRCRDSEDVLIQVVVVRVWSVRESSPASHL